MRPSEDATISCGSGPDGTLPRTFNVAGSTTDIVRSVFASTRSLPEDGGSCPCAWTRVIAATIATANNGIRRLKIIEHYISRGASPLGTPLHALSLAAAPARSVSASAKATARPRRSAFGAKAGAWLARDARSHSADEPARLQLLTDRGCVRPRFTREKASDKRPKKINAERGRLL